MCAGVCLALASAFLGATSGKPRMPHAKRATRFARRIGGGNRLFRHVLGPC
jgi:hypothetical protein